MINAQIGTWKEVISGGPKVSDVIKSVRCFYWVIHEGTKNILLEWVSNLSRGEGCRQVSETWKGNYRSIFLRCAVGQARGPTEAQQISHSALRWAEISFPPWYLGTIPNSKSKQKYVTSTLQEVTMKGRKREPGGASLRSHFSEYESCERGHL